MAKSKFLIFPETSSAPAAFPNSFDGSCIFLVAQAENHECQDPSRMPLCLLYSKSNHQQILLALSSEYIQSLSTPHFLHCCLSDPSHHHLLSILLQWPPNWSLASTLICLQAFLRIAAREPLLRWVIRPHLSYHPPQAPCIPYLTNFSLSPAHTSTRPSQLLVRPLGYSSPSNYMIHLLPFFP